MTKKSALVSSTVLIMIGLLAVTALTGCSSNKTTKNEESSDTFTMNIDGYVGGPCPFELSERDDDDNVKTTSTCVDSEDAEDLIAQAQEEIASYEAEEKAVLSRSGNPYITFTAETHRETREVGNGATPTTQLVTKEFLIIDEVKNFEIFKGFYK